MGSNENERVKFQSKEVKPTLEVGHVNVGPGIESVDDHFAIDRSRDLHATVPHVVRDRRAPPVGVVGGVRMRLPHGRPRAAGRRGRLEVGQGSAVEFEGPACAGVQERASAVLELVAEVSDETQRVGGEDLGGGRADGCVDLDDDGSRSGFHVF